MSSRLVTFIIVNYRCSAKVDAAVSSIFRFCDVPFEVVVVDNSESNAELQSLTSALSERARVVAAPKNGGFGYGCNLGARHAQGEYLFFLNPDAELTSRCIGRLIDHLVTERNIGAVGGRLVYPDGAEGHSSGKFITLRRPLQMIKGSAYGFRDRLMGRTTSKSPVHLVGRALRRVDWCSGADLLVRADDFAAIGGFDESYFLYYEECDLQYRMFKQLHLTAVIDGSVDIRHEDGGTGLENERKRRLIEEGCLHFVRDHRPFWHARLYHMLMLSALTVEATLQLATLRFTQYPADLRLMTHLASL